ncbi:eukaryotic translation initiation factor NCBP-like [Helianthus annuus]|uniref:eukaryotic translation initiation factor NCBP-like n=1 Tax=Helianthus annuus TaxID=4232 RepID=UPI000B8F101B|nr:eukaryotic translation initiation factor NCBP-like [Helianthus annuus]
MNSNLHSSKLDIEEAGRKKVQVLGIRKSHKIEVVMALRDKIKRHLKLPHGYVMEYKPHDASLRDNSSYRNTWLRG